MTGEPAPKGHLSWDEINDALRGVAAHHRKVFVVDRPKRHAEEATFFIDGVMYAHRALYTRALKHGHAGHHRPEPRPTVDAYEALTAALHPAAWLYVGTKDPIADVLGRMRDLGFEFVRQIDPKEGERTALPTGQQGALT